MSLDYCSNMIIHKLTKTQIKYGYIWWGVENEAKYEKVLPKGTFDIKIEDEIVENRKVDWKRHRLYVGIARLKKFKSGDQIIINKLSNKLIEITHK